MRNEITEVLLSYDCHFIGLADNIQALYKPIVDGLAESNKLTTHHIEESVKKDIEINECHQMLDDMKELINNYEVELESYKVPYARYTLDINELKQKANEDYKQYKAEIRALESALDNISNSVVRDMVEFAEWIADKYLKKYDQNNWYAKCENTAITKTTKELYKEFLNRLDP